MRDDFDVVVRHRRIRADEQARGPMRGSIRHIRPARPGFEPADETIERLDRP